MADADRWDDVRHLVGLVHGMQAPLEHLKPVQHWDVVVQVTGLMQHAPLAHTCPGGQQVPLQHVSWVVQHVWLQVVVPDGHSHWHVVALNTCPDGQGPAHMPVLGHSFVPGGHAQVAVAGLQKSLQQSEFWRQLWPPSRHWPGELASARPGATRLTKPAAVAAPNSFSALRPDVALESSFERSAKVSSVIGSISRCL